MLIGFVAGADKTPITGTVKRVDVKRRYKTAWPRKPFPRKKLSHLWRYKTPTCRKYCFYLDLWPI